MRSTPSDFLVGTGQEVFKLHDVTINAAEHELLKHFHYVEEEKRMFVILHEDQWLEAPASASMDFMRQVPAHLLMATAEPERGKRKKKAPDEGDVGELDWS